MLGKVYRIGSVTHMRVTDPIQYTLPKYVIDQLKIGFVNECNKDNTCETMRDEYGPVYNQPISLEYSFIPPYHEKTKI